MRHRQSGVGGAAGARQTPQRPGVVTIGERAAQRQHNDRLATPDRRRTPRCCRPAPVEAPDASLWGLAADGPPRRRPDDLAARPPSGRRPPCAQPLPPDVCPPNRLRPAGSALGSCFRRAAELVSGLRSCMLKLTLYSIIVSRESMSTGLRPLASLART